METHCSVGQRGPKLNNDLAWKHIAGVLQYPVGRFSDSFDRRRVMVIMAIMAGICSFIIAFADPSFYKVMIIGSFFLGGFCFTLYPISINHACDNIDSKAILAATQGLLFAYSIGSSFGAPSAAPATQLQPEPNGAQTRTNTSQTVKVLRLPRKSTSRCTKCCACHAEIAPDAQSAAQK